ncbi:MAG TPA: hypothetical protein VG268_08820 [Streptosporangiaceae bacterium]|nr:hypothetical protein [Streptosporangiaceae bacterium]
MLVLGDHGDIRQATARASPSSKPRLLLSGWSSAEAYLPSQKIAIAVAATFLPSGFNAQGAEPNASDPIFRAIGAYMAPGDPPPVKK